MPHAKDLKGLFALLLALPLLAWFMGGLVWDVFINPRPPAAVSSESFRFEDFGTHPDAQLALQRSLRRLFPSGTDKAEVDKVLVEKAGARVRGEERRAIYSHAAPSFLPLLCHPTWNVFVTYDAALAVESLRVRRLCYSAHAEDEPDWSKPWQGKGSF
jgi:hypothetical protein